MKNLIIAGLLLVGLNSCNNIVEVDHPLVDPRGYLEQTDPLTDESKEVMEGVYSVVQGNDQFGSHVILKWSRKSLSIFTSKDVGYFVLDGGDLDTSLFFTGHWRFNVNSETGLADFNISLDEGGSKILDGDTSNLKITIRGAYGEGNGTPGQPVVLEYERPFSQFVKETKFGILAHRGGGRNSEYLGVSENSLEMIDQAEGFGANGVEIDVKVSADGVPFLYHDADINLRLTQKGVIWGPIEDFTWPVLRNFITLKNGEKIPTLQEALDFIVEKTELKFVWLDLKSETDEIPKVAELQKQALEKAASMNRDLSIVIGLPTEEKANNFMLLPGFEDVGALCELDVNVARQTDADIWAPRWTQGTQLELVQEMHSEGRLVFVWTLDEPAFIESYIRDGDFDGILSNYPSLIAYYHYIR
jgi:glycerophosphoryl diester phosphodiesterase